MAGPVAIGRRPVILGLGAGAVATAAGCANPRALDSGAPRVPDTTRIVAPQVVGNVEGSRPAGLAPLNDGGVIGAQTPVRGGTVPANGIYRASLVAAAQAQIVALTSGTTTNPALSDVPATLQAVAALNSGVFLAAGAKGLYIAQNSRVVLVEFEGDNNLGGGLAIFESTVFMAAANVQGLAEMTGLSADRAVKHIPAVLLEHWLSADGTLEGTNEIDLDGKNATGVINRTLSDGTPNGEIVVLTAGEKEGEQPVINIVSAGSGKVTGSFEIPTPHGSSDWVASMHPTLAYGRDTDGRDFVLISSAYVDGGNDAFVTKVYLDDGSYSYRTFGEQARISEVIYADGVALAISDDRAKAYRINTDTMEITDAISLSDPNVARPGLGTNVNGNAVFTLNSELLSIPLR
jgi:hypothetical protein